ncbi:cache domain-containing protein, partial [Mesorhizobium marinum]|uniref:cache domain-containing protein n=1 Tax=Mesorhizobium marinum TaxID=3228790 RepID=UPI0034675BA1
MKTLAVTAAVLGLLGAVTSGFAEDADRGTAAEARAMLDRVVIAVKADKAKALASIATGGDGFLDRDLYPFCFNNTDGIIHPYPNPSSKSLFGQDERTVKDAVGKNVGQELYDAAQKPEGQVSEVSYVYFRPSDGSPAPKVSFVTRIGDLGCGVGYY